MRLASTYERGKLERNAFTLLAQGKASMPFSSITDQGCVFRENTDNQHWLNSKFNIWILESENK